jgi:acid phosphatase type 7
LTLNRSLSIVLIVITLGALSPLQGRASTGEKIAWGPYITGTTGTETYISWKTDGETWGVIQYALEPQFSLTGAWDEFVIDPLPSKLHRVELAGLKPSATYRYRVWTLSAAVSPDSFAPDNMEDAQSWLLAHAEVTPEYSFRTLGDGVFSFAVYGDTQEQTPWFTQLERHRLVASSIAREDGLSFVVHLGDFTYDADNLAGWDQFFEAAREMLANHTLYPILGNHENSSPVYFEIFGMPAYYSFQSGSTRFLMLNTTGQADFDAQRSWLQTEFSSGPVQNFVFYHHPSYSSDTRNYGGWESSRSHWEDIFVSRGVDAVFSGHVHAYERYSIKGINYFVVGTGGGVLADLIPETPPGIQNRLEKTLGYVRVNIGRDGTAVEFVKVARISDDNRQILEIYPYRTVYETVSLKPRAAAPAGEFTVSPVSLSLQVDGESGSRFNVYITSSHDSQVHVDTEGLPFSVNPALLQIQGSEQAQKFELEIFGSRSIANGQYEGKLTFLRDVGDNVALGVKVRTTVAQTGRELGFFEGGWADFFGNDILLITAVVLVVTANIGGYLIYRRYRSRISQEKGFL